ncbi:DGQHR domain-containing protein [Listeria booriae]|uniref:DGQHR domain-containing protein n=1 Tax=Listeria booriae TaxID=1552123 RepID=UPI00162A2C6C|nr:DGQHR domain-containing protein [Listeria booriae]MBC2196404.1 DGQHR domain-containing protein [Listeria booriae]
MKKIALKYTQSKQEFYSTTLNFFTIDSIAEVLEFNKTKFGYQRELNELHLKKMVKTLKDQQEILSPTSIILGVNRTYIDSIISPIEQDKRCDETTENDEIKMINFDFDIKEKQFRVIDGQHRIAALREYIKTLELQSEDYELWNYQYAFSVIIVVIEDKSRITEVKMFKSINSKAKRLKLDLAMLAEFRYEIIEARSDINYNLHANTRVIYKLISKIEEGVNYWENGVKVNVTEKKSLGSIAYKGFYESIDKIFIVSEQNAHLKKYGKELEFECIDNVLNQYAETMVIEFLIPAWEIIHDKWAEAFREEEVFYNGEIERIYYNNDYYIQQNMGANALNRLLGDILIEKGEYALAIEEFRKIIKESNLTSQSWRKNGVMRGLSSEAGIKIITSMIKNEIHEY